MPDPAAYEPPHIQVALTEPKSLGPEMRNSNFKNPIKVHKYRSSSVPKCRPNPNRNHILSSLHASQHRSELLSTHNPALTPTLHPAIVSHPTSDPALCCKLHCYRFTGKLSDPACSAQADKGVWKVMGIIVAAVLGALVFYGNWHWTRS